MKRRSSPSPIPTVREVHYVLSTHWDREWYQTFQAFRHRLVHLLDRVIADLDSGALRGPFTTDGQSIILDDYLEVRPERTEDVKRLVRDGKLVVGPWFVLPDEWLVSGESLIRNIELGRLSARRFGAEPSDAGFVCDLFGHVSQLPQILAGFGIQGAFLWRGLEPRGDAFLWWRGADGTRILCYRFPRTAYCDFAWDVRRSHQHHLPFDAARAARDIANNLARETGRAAEGPLLLFDGGDHLEHDLEPYRVLMAQKTDAAFPYAIRHSTLDAFLAEAKKHAGSIRQEVVGELRETGARPLVEDQQWLIPGVLSSRVWIKQSNARCQHLLCHWAEPFGAAAAAWCGVSYPSGFLSVAWRWLLMNHPHDSICGCSIDAVHEDMKYRFAQCAQIGEATTHEALLSLAAAISGPIGEREVRVLVANPVARALDQGVELTLQLPADWRCFNEFFGFEPKPGFRIFGPDGAEIPYQRLSQDMNRTKSRPFPRHFPQVYRTNDVGVALRLAIPPLGYTTLTVREGTMTDKDDIVAATMLPTRHPQQPGFATSERSMSNGVLAVTIESNGSLTLTDLRSGQNYSRLLTFEDAADIGDGWYRGEAVNDQVFTSTAAASDVALLADGPELTRFRIRTTLRVPADFDFTRMVRSGKLVEVILESDLTLRRGADRLEVQTVVENTACDHRIRVLFPSGAKTDTYLSDSAFDIVSRAVALPADNHLRRELAVETTPQQSWTAVHDRRRGLAVIAPGLMETAVRDHADRPLALTLFRGTRRTVFTDGEPNGQLRGTLAFSYWIVPLTGAPNRARLCDAAIELGAGLRSEQLTAPALAALFAPVRPGLTPSASLLRARGVVVTSTRQNGGALEVRCFNPDERTIAAELDFSGRPADAPLPREAQRVDFEGRALGRRLTLRSGRLRFSAKAKEIITLRIRMDSRT
jgi:alpha-mannosidase/mannosylglycerate hydrolase